MAAHQLYLLQCVACHCGGWIDVHGAVHVRVRVRVCGAIGRVYLSVSFCLSVCLSARLSGWLSVCAFVCLWWVCLVKGTVWRCWTSPTATILAA